MADSLTYLLEFNMLSTFPDHWEGISLIKGILSESGFTPVYENRTGDDGLRIGHVHLVAGNGNYATIVAHTDGHITLDLHFIIGDATRSTCDKRVEVIEAALSKKLQQKNAKSLPAISRGGKFTSYFPTTDGKLIEYDFDACVFEADSAFQNIKIMHSPQFGNMLILDDDPNLAESDILYTEAITGFPKEDYTNKDVLVLGGGDGGILHELLKQHPNFITMVDIDGMVVEAAKKHLRGICFDSMDEMKGSNYEVLIADCLPLLKKYGEERRQFDYVINDLTAIPVTTTPQGDQWDFLRLILDLSMTVLKSSGKYYTQGNGSNRKDALAMYEEQLKKLTSPVEFRTKNIFVPSYHEQWVFYEIWKKSPSSCEETK